MYSEKVMDHFQNPRNVGEIENASGVGTVGNAKCEEILCVFIWILMKTRLSKTVNLKPLVRRSSGNQQYGNRAGQRENHSGSPAGNQ